MGLRATDGAGGCSRLPETSSPATKTARGIPRTSHCMFMTGQLLDREGRAAMGENAPEIMVEYKKNLDLSLAISVVNERHRRAEEEREAVKRRTEMEEARAAGAPVREDTGAAAPQVVPKRVEQAAVERLTVSFRVTDTRERLRLLKQFLVSNGYQYE